VAKVKEAVDIPIIASLNGVSRGGWTHYAKLLQEAGADALELNIYYVATELNVSGAELEAAHVDLVRGVREEVTVPVSVKLAPFYTSLPNVASQMVAAGANGLVLFNRFYQPELDLEALAVVPTVVLSRSDELRVPLRWIAILSAKLQCDFAATSGVSEGEDVVKSIMAGASVVQVASELLRGGIERVETLVAEVVEWMERADYESVAQMRGSMNQRAVSEPAAFERANYMKALSSLDYSQP
jgi:dihydroorotate dehydrogenase (fumarate)